MVNLVPDAELDRIRVDAVGLLQSTCSISALTKTSDGGGSWSESWTTVATDVPCRRAPMGKSASLSGGRISEDSTHIFTFPADTNIALSSRIFNEGSIWEVTGYPKRTAFDEFVLRVEAKEVDRA